MRFNASQKTRGVLRGVMQNPGVPEVINRALRLINLNRVNRYRDAIERIVLPVCCSLHGLVVSLTVSKLLTSYGCLKCRAVLGIGQFFGENV